MKNLKKIQISSRSLSYLFLGLIFVGIFGRWILLPSIKRIHEVGRTEDYQSIFEEANSSCLKDISCTPRDLLSPFFLQEKNVTLAREYISSHFEILKAKNELITFQVLGILIENHERFNFVNHDYLKSLTPQQKAGFFEGLFHCTLAGCLEYFQKNIEVISQIATRVQFLKMSLKQEGSWTIKNKELDELIELIVTEDSYVQLISLIEYIPNHPKLRAKIEKHYLQITGEINIQKAAIHLARYNQGWHDRKFTQVFESQNLSHINNFIISMKISCPQKFKVMFDSYFEKLSKNAQELFLNELRYLAKPDDKTFKKLDTVMNSKCLTGESDF